MIDEDTVRTERAFKRFVDTMAAAQRAYDATIPESEREMAEGCTCQLCEAMAQFRSVVSEYEGALGQARAALLGLMLRRGT